MATKIKWIVKGFKYVAQIFVVKEQDMEIGYPTDVKHVAHIGWDGVSGTPPSWMSEFKPGPDFNKSFGGNPRDSNSTTTNSWSSPDYDQPKGSQKFRDSPSSADISNTAKNQNQEKKSTSSTRCNSSMSSRISSKSKHNQKEPSARF
ncbi:hypothetical protein SLA2020_259310 [Shorea laevis]